MQRSIFIKSCGLLFLLVCASASPCVFAQDGPPESQKFGIGLKVLAGDGLTALGANARFWTESKLGFEVGWATDGKSKLGLEDELDTDGYSELWTNTFHIIPASLLYTLTHVNAGSVYIRPYVGGGVNITRFSKNVGDSLNKLLGTYGSISASSIIFGGQGFGGAEFTFKSVPRLSFGGDVGIHRICENIGFKAGVQVHYYLK